MVMNFDEYQKGSKKTAIYPKKNKYIYTTLGLLGEAGEIAEKMKRIYRGEDDGKITEQRKQAIAKEIGDLLWYLNQLATELNLSVNDIAEDNLKKLFSRKRRGKIKGDGDNR